jgi:hypothetical protein
VISEVNGRCLGRAGAHSGRTCIRWNWGARREGSSHSTMRNPDGLRSSGNHR